MAWKDGAAERLLQIIQDEQDKPVMVTAYVLAAVCVTDDGDEDFLTNVAPDQRAMTTIGLLRGTLAIEEAGFVQHFLYGE